MYGHIVSYIEVEMSCSIEYHRRGLEIRVLIFFWGSFFLAQEVYAKLLVIERNVIVSTIRWAWAMFFKLEQSSGVNSGFAGHVLAKYCLYVFSKKQSQCTSVQLRECDIKFEQIGVI